MSDVPLRAILLLVLSVVLLPDSLSAQQITRSDAAQRVAALQTQQCEVQASVRLLTRTAGPELDASIQRLLATKGAMLVELSSLEAQLRVSEELQGVVETMQSSRLVDRLTYSRGTIEQWRDGSENRIEALIQANLTELGRALVPTASAPQCPTPA